MSEPESTPSGNSKVLIATAVITALTTIVVAFVGIVPQLRSGDKGAVAQLQKELDDLKKTSADTTAGVGGTPDKKLTISGVVTSEDGTKTLSGRDIYLVPEGYNLLTKTDDDGKFTLQGVPSGVYSIIVRDSTDGISGRVILDDDLRPGEFHRRQDQLPHSGVSRTHRCWERKAP